MHLECSWYKEGKTTRVFSRLIFPNKILSGGNKPIQKQVKINAGKIERRCGVVMTPFSSSKMIQINCQE